MTKQVIVPIFVPHQGCPHQCSFCNQRTISGTQRPPTPDQVKALLESALDNLGKRAHGGQIAFFGGSFTAIGQEYRTALLEAARPFVGQGGFSGIRISTRSDYINESILKQLVTYGVTVVELGVQSLSDRVLRHNNRGHSAEDVERASRLIRRYGIFLGHQMMTGLWGDDDAGAMETAKNIAEIKPDMVRIYPTVVLPGTRLEELYQEGSYKPQTLEEAVALGASLLELFAEQGIPVIRLGLHDEEGLGQAIVAGPHHPALRELCEGRLMLRRALEQLEAKQFNTATLLVHPRCISKMTGQRQVNKQELERRGYKIRVRPDESIPPLQVRVEQYTQMDSTR